MKKILFSVLLLGVASLANAQRNEVIEAQKQWNLLALGKDKTLAENLKTLNIGLEHTTKAIAHEKTKDQLEPWLYRALFASRISLVDSLDLANSIANQKIAEEAIEKAKALDKKGAEKENIENAFLNVESAVRNRGIFAYNKKDYLGAYNAFIEVTKRNPTDTGMYLNAGVAAKEVEKYPEAISAFKKAIELGYKEHKGLFMDIVSMTFSKLKDTTAGMSLLEEGAVKYPEEAYFIGLQTDLYIKKGDIAKSQELLTKLLASEPNNSLYQYLMGNTYFNQALAIQTDRNKVDSKNTKLFNEMTAKMTKFIDSAIPFYLKAVELDPKNVNALDNLKTIYVFKNDTVKYEEVKKKLDAVLPAE